MLLQPVLCCFRQPIHFLCLCSMCMQFSMTNMFLILCACARVYICLPQIKLIFICIYLKKINAHYLLVSRFTGVHFNKNSMNVHVLNIL